MSRKMTRALAAAVLAASIVPGLALTTGTAVADASATQQFVGFGPLPSDAHADALRQMQAFSPSCVEISTVLGEAGSEHFWMATLTADC